MKAKYFPKCHFFENKCAKTVLFFGEASKLLKNSPKKVATGEWVTGGKLGYGMKNGAQIKQLLPGVIIIELLMIKPS